MGTRTIVSLPTSDETLWAHLGCYTLFWSGGAADYGGSDHLLDSTGADKHNDETTKIVNVTAV